MVKSRAASAIVVISAKENLPAQTTGRAAGRMSSSLSVPVSRSPANAAAPAATAYKTVHTKAID